MKIEIESKIKKIGNGYFIPVPKKLIESLNKKIDSKITIEIIK